MTVLPGSHVHPFVLENSVVWTGAEECVECVVWVRCAPPTEHASQHVHQIVWAGTADRTGVRERAEHVIVGRCVRVVSALRSAHRTVFRMLVSVETMVVGEHVVTVEDS